MPMNMEVKARITELADNIILATHVCGTTGAQVIDQKDTFFGTVKDGTLLKLREENNRSLMQKKNVLIGYTREAKIGAKPSEYIITPVADVPSMIEALSMTNTKLGEVYKTRHLFLTSRNGLNARVHLDTVKGLGDFIEFEVQMEDRYQESFAKDFAAYLCHQFQIKEKDHVAGAYFDLKQKILQDQEAAALAAKIQKEAADRAEAEAASKKD